MKKRLRFTNGQIIGCCIGGSVFGLLYGGGHWQVWTDPIGDALGGVLVAFLLVFVVNLIGAVYVALFKRNSA